MKNGLQHPADTILKAMSEARLTKDNKQERRLANKTALILSNTPQPGRTIEQTYTNQRLSLK